MKTNNNFSVNNWSLIKEPLLTEKSLKLAKEKNQYTFKVEKKINKLVVKKNLEKIFNIHILNINIINVSKKKKYTRSKNGKKLGFSAGYKKAIIQIPKNEKINLFFK